MKEETLTIHNSLLVITKEGVLIRIHCPFPVMVISPVEPLRRGDVHRVVSVHMGEVKLLYVISDHPYCASIFVILGK